jgi:hypothetical protein
MEKNPFDSFESSEDFINEVLKMAKEKSLTVNDVKLSLKAIDEAVEKTKVEETQLQLSYSRANGIELLFK